MGNTLDKFMENNFGLIGLDEEEIKEFESFKRDSGRIRYCWNRLNPNIDNRFGPGKNLLLASAARAEGNNLYKAKNFMEALEQYNKSICLSPSDSENIGICYANRSAIYFESRLYGLCLANIDLALAHQYANRDKLKDRRNKCHEKLSADKQELYNNEVPLVKITDPNKKLPHISDKIEYMKSEEFGSYLRAKDTIYPGDILMVEKPYFKCLNVGSAYNKCNNCLKSNFLNLFPCPHCTKAMYCGSSCEKEAWKRFHKYECQVLETDEYRLDVRAALVSFTLFDDISELKDLIDSIKIKPVTSFNLDHKDVKEKDTFKAVYSLATNGSKRDIKDTFNRAHCLAKSWSSLITHERLRQLLRTNEEEDFFLDTLFHFSELLSINKHQTAQITNYETPIPETFGLGIYPIISLLNHSCAPNVMRVTNNDSIVIMALRSIKSGEQLFDCYDMYHISETRQKRQNHLQNTYFFECKCEACLGDWPLLGELKKKGLTKFNHIDNYHTNKYDREWAKEYFQKCKVFLKKFGHHFPSYEVSKAHVLMRMSSCILYDNTPLKYQLTPN